MSEGDGNPSVLILGVVFPNQRFGGLRRRLEKLKDRWGKTTCVVTQLADGYLLWREMFFTLFMVINLSPSPLPPSMACVLRSSAQTAPGA